MKWQQWPVASLLVATLTLASVFINDMTSFSRASMVFTTVCIALAFLVSVLALGRLFWLVFNRLRRDDIAITLVNVVDSYTSYVMVWTMLFYLFPGWTMATGSTTSFFTEISPTRNSAWRLWVQMFYVSTLIQSGLGVARYQPDDTSLELLVALYTYSFWLLGTTLVGAAMALVSSNIKEGAHDNDDAPPKYRRKRTA